MEEKSVECIEPTKASFIPPVVEVVWGAGLITGGAVIVPVLVVLVVVPLVVEVDVGVGALAVLEVVTFAVGEEVGVYVDELVSWPLLDGTTVDLDVVGIAPGVVGPSSEVLAKVEVTLVCAAPDVDVCIGRLVLELLPGGAKCEVEFAELPLEVITVVLVLAWVLGLGNTSVPGLEVVGGSELCTGSTEL